MAPQTLKDRITFLYEGETDAAHRFRYGLLAIDVATILFLVVATFIYGHPLVEWVGIALGLYIALDYAARIWISPAKVSFVLSPLNIADLVVIVSFLLPLLGANLSFLRALRVLRLLRSYRVLNRLRADVTFFSRNEAIILSATNLFIFIFMMTELVFVTQVGINEDVTNFLDAMYFTIAALTTTGFGDVTLQGQSGRMISIVIIIFGVSLFLRLVQTIFRPSKVRFPCPACGLVLHENDAVHCKHCGGVLNIPSDGDV